MTVIRLQAFGGVIPVAGDRALPDGFAADSKNTWLYGQELRGARPQADIISVASSTRKVLRIPDPTKLASDLSDVDNVWKLFTDPDTDFALSPVVNDSFKRVYWASPSSGPRYNTYANLQAGITPAGFKLGVPAPATAAGGSVSGGSGTVVTRSYVYTYVDVYGQESAPSTPVVIAGFANGTWNITGIVDPAGGAFTDRAAFSKKYLYRTITSLSGVATFFRITDVAAGTSTYADTMADTVLAGNLQLESTTWAMPPETLKGLVLMPNGFMIGWDGKDIYLSEAYHPHAWPAEYVVTSEYPVVGLGVIGTTCVVCTQGFPSSLTGTTPAATAFIKSTSNEPCLSRGSIVSTPQGVIYASQNGLVLATPQGLSNVTEQLITREDWIRNYTPTDLRAARYQNGYLALRAVTSLEARTAFYLDPSALQVALTEFTVFANCYNIFPDNWSGEVLMIQNDKIKRWDPPSDDLLPVLWKSKEFTLPKKMNFGCYSVYFDADRYAANTIGTDIIATGVKVRFRAWCNRVLRYDEEFVASGEAQRLPSGFKGDIWQFEVRARAPVYAIHIATTEKELASL